MSLIFPKKEILYAPMLGTLGGGSIKGFGFGGGGVPTGEAVFTTVGGTDGSSTGISWTIPEGVKTISFVTVGGAGGRYSTGGGGGALAYKNNIDVSSVNFVSVFVGQSGGYNGSGGASYVQVGGLTYAIAYGGHSGVCGGCGTPNNRGYSNFSNADGGGRGGPGGVGGGSGSNGGGAGGYSGDGGGPNTAGAGGGGGGGYTGGGSGGGVGLYGQGANGTAGNSSVQDGGGGSGGTNGGISPAYGGGPGTNNGNYQGQNGTGNGAVRIVWGKNRSFPSTNVDLASSDGNVSTY